MLSTYVTWILVILALVAGAWVLIRPSGGGRPNAANAPPGEPSTAEMTTPDDGPTTTTTRTTPLHAVTTSQRPPVDVPPMEDRMRSEPPPTLASGAGLGDMPAMPPLGMWSDGYAQSVRERWRELQLRFIDDPHSVANDAERVVEETVEALTASLNAFKKDLDAWRSGPGDTEQLRAAVHRYRDFLDRLLGS
ncbi:hypothetical protein [Planosporangium mesophilum]|uniref:Uncharacterized protein n=1 Tax=Planosporangium mesophilum TaxID=689768 RepID=A0A8J3TBB6_9ACTN|nr:hypothetical protein [Planosporangium mesophilum]NJC83370.1 hypothetical protein [Planosporangium mesophilum]GII21749.1 hypothetical protein Pme01_13460 [Planosporangium mesophilum]